MGCLRLRYREASPLLKVVKGKSATLKKSGVGMYRYGFQGQEKDTETGLVNYKFRMHDPRIGRFFAVDPLAAQFSFQSPYAFSSNRVIDMIELEGAETFRPFLLRPMGWNLMLETGLESQALMLKHPTWSDLKIFWMARWNVAMGRTHTTLDIIGMIPAFGEVADGVNGGIYLLQGDAVNATISFAATIPILGWGATGAKWAGKVIKSSKGAKMVLNFTRKSDGLISFGSRDQLKRIIGTVIGEEAHHIIPWALRESKVVQYAAEAGFHMNDALNGIALKKYLKQGIGDGLHASHPAYSTWVDTHLKKFTKLQGDNLTPKMAKDYIQNELIPTLEKHINKAKNSSGNLNDYFKVLNKQ